MKGFEISAGALHMIILNVEQFPGNASPGKHISIAIQSREEPILLSPDDVVTLFTHTNKVDCVCVRKRNDHATSQVINKSESLWRSIEVDVVVLASNGAHEEVGFDSSVEKSCNVINIETSQIFAWHPSCGFLETTIVFVIVLHKFVLYYVLNDVQVGPMDLNSISESKTFVMVLKIAFFVVGFNCICWNSSKISFFIFKVFATKEEYLQKISFFAKFFFVNLKTERGQKFQFCFFIAVNILIDQGVIMNFAKIFVLNVQHFDVLDCSRTANFRQFIFLVKLIVHQFLHIFVQIWEKCVWAKSHEILCIFWKYFLSHLPFHYGLHLSSIVVLEIEIGSLVRSEAVCYHNVVSGFGIQLSLFGFWRNIVDKESHTCWVGRIFSERHNSAFSHNTFFSIASQLAIFSQIVEIDLRWARNDHDFKLFVDVNCLGF